ncbi:MAG: NAD(P)/FAD-dependent oxidoreductase [Candidatus Puniceispirillum sp.]
MSALPPSAIAQSWLDHLGHALASSTASTLQPLFQKDSFWRDALGLSWQIQTIGGDAKIADHLLSAAQAAGLADLQMDNSQTAPMLVTRAGISALEAFFRFETKYVRGRGIFRLCQDPDDQSVWRCWNFFTAAEELIGFEEKIGRKRPTGQSYSRDFRGPNWLDKRMAARAYDDRDPQVLVVGGGQAGLSIAARLTQLGVDTLIVDKNEKVGDNWRNRYHALTLHNQLHVNHLPYLPFPITWPTYIPKDMLALWFDSYAATMELNFWTGSEVIAAQYDASQARWQASIKQRDGTIRRLAPRHIILATGVSGIPNLPSIDTLDHFAGPVLHSSQYRDGDDWAGKRAIVVGCGNSGHDISHDLWSSGAQVTMIQRSPSLVVNIEPSAQFPYKLYDEDRSTEECDFITTSMPLPVTKKAHQQFTRQSRDADKQLLDGLTEIGFKLDFGEDDTGWQFKYLTRGGGYYFNVGCSNLLVEEKVNLVQFDQIAHFDTDGMTMKDGRKVGADLIVLATGYKPQEHLVEQLFGKSVADRVGPIWGFGNGFELRNMYCQTGQPGLWFIAGSFAQCRINSKYLALQIKAVEEGLMPAKRADSA